MPETTAEDIVKLHSSNRTNASLAVTSGVDANPDQAARAMELSRSSGVEGSIIYDDMDEFERNYKAQMAGAIVRNNPHLTEFVRSNPMVPKIANDDYGNLDTVSQKTSALDLPMKVLRLPEAIGKLMWPDNYDPLQRFTEGGPLGNWLLQDPIARNDYRLLSSIITGLPPVVAAELTLRGLGGVQNILADSTVNLVSSVNPSLGRDLGAMIQSAGLMGRTGLVEHPIYKATEAIGPIKHWIDNGREPPPGILPEYDAFRAERNQRDVESLSEVVADAQTSLVRERNPDLFRDFIRQHTDAEIGIGGDAIVALYGDKRPLPDDGLLGWVPGIAEQLELARKSGDDIHIPLADWVARVEPEVMKALADDIRVRPGSITAREAQLATEASAAQPPPIPLPEEVPAQRSAAGLEPLLSVGDRNIRMEKREAISQDTADFRGGAIPADQWRLLDEQGNKIGHLELTPAGKDLMVDMVMGLNGLGPRDFGPALMRSLLRQIKENYPEAERLGGYRISGAREKAGTEAAAWIKLDNPKGWDTVETANELRRMLEGGQWETYSPKTQAYIKPYFERSEQDRALVDIVSQELDRIVPKKLAVQEAERITTSNARGVGEPIEPTGIYIQYKETYPIILYALEGPDPLGTARHEAIHHLRNYNFFDANEWGALERASKEHGWQEQFGIDRRYPTGTDGLKLEESIADAYKEWAAGRLGEVPLEITTLFERMKAFFDAIIKRIGEALGKEPTWQDIFQKVDTGEIGAREGTKPLDPRAFDEKLSAPLAQETLDSARGRDNEADVLNARLRQIRYEMAQTRKAGFDTATEEYAGHRNSIAALQNRIREVTVVDEKLSVPEEPSRIFERANALGMTIEQYKRYDKLIAARHAEDIASAEKRVGDAQKRVQTKEWKANRAELRKDIAEEINLRPDIAADNYFADGVLYGEKVDRIKLGTDYLTEQQRASLPRDYYNKAGASPDDLAGLFGFPDGATLVGHLSGLSEIRRQSGMRPIEFKRRVIDIETDRQMQVKYGVLEDNIMDAVKEQVASETQLSLLHEETLYYGIKADQVPLDQATIKREVAADFDTYASTAVSSDRFLALAGRAGKAVENALLKQDYATAFVQKQHQYYSVLLAKHAIEFENQIAKFEKLATRLAKREVKAVEPEYLDFIHGLLLEAGAPVKRSLSEVNESKVYHGQTDLAKFVEGKDKDGWGMGEVMSDEILAGQIKSFDSMSVAEMRDFMNAVTALNHVGRKVRQLEIAGQKRDWNEFRAEVIKNIEELPLRTDASLGKGGKGRYIYGFDAQLTRMEEIVKDLDLRKELGPLHQAVIEPMMRSKATEFDLKTDLSKHFVETRGAFDGKWRKSLKDTIDQDIIVDPRTSSVHSERAPYDMTRENLIQIMLNWGNRSNIGKIVQGFAMAKWGRRLTKEEFPVYEASIKGLIDKHATLQDWQFVQRMWEPFEGWKESMKDVSRSTSGVVPKMIENAPVETPHGTFNGGYWPVRYDKLRSDIAVIEDRKPTDDGVFGNNYFRAATAKGHLKERTGHVDFVDISNSLEQAASTMQQTMHDIAFRDSLIQAGRVFYDKDIRTAMRNHYGPEYEKQLVPWLRRIANQFSEDPSVGSMNDFLRRTRTNLVGHALPLNLKVILSPDIGTPMTGLKVTGQTIGRILQAPLPDSWANFRANREANMKLAMEKSDEIRHLVYNMDRDFRESLDRITLDPNVSDFQKKAVMWGFIPIAKVSQEFRVSTFVEQYHKALERGKTEQEAALIADSFVRERHGAASVVDLPAIMQSNEAMKMYTTFYGFFNTMYNWQRQLPGNVRRGEWSKFTENALGSVVVGAAFGATLFNQRKEDDSWFKIIGKAMLLQPLSTIPIVREASSYAMEGYQPRSPLGSLLGAVGSIYTDAKHLHKGERLEKPITHAANVIGLTTGLPAAQIGRTSQFTSDVIRGRQKPKNIADWARGIITGEAKLKK